MKTPSLSEKYSKSEISHAHVKFEHCPQTTEEVVIVWRVRGGFADDGDAGAPVFDYEGNLVGVVLGGIMGEPKKIAGQESLGAVMRSYIIPIQLLQDRIRTETGKSIVIDEVCLEDLLARRVTLV